MNSTNPGGSVNKPHKCMESDCEARVPRVYTRCMKCHRRYLSRITSTMFNRPSRYQTKDPSRQIY